MPDRRTQSHALRRLVPATLLALCASALLSVPLAGARSVEFGASAGPKRPINLGVEQPKLGVSGTVTFSTNRADKQALNAAKQQEQLLADADSNISAATSASTRIAAIEQLLADAEGDEAKLSAAIAERAVERYKGGENADMSFLISGNSLSDLITRSRVLQDQNARDERMRADYQLTIARIELHKQVLEELRDITGEQAQSLTERADRLDDVLVAARTGHDEAPDPIASNKQKGVSGTWYIMDGAFQAQLFLPNAGSGYDGGARTPARAPTPQQIQRVLSDRRIEFTASGYGDVLARQIDGRLLDALSAAANQFGRVKVTSLKRDHGVYTSSGNVSAHSFGCAADIGTIGSTYITPGSQTPGGEVDQAVRFFASLPGDLAPHQVISLFNFGGSTLAMGDHGDHIHLGYSC